jgi:ParB-like chromosome segregation protein Spo0J
MIVSDHIPSPAERIQFQLLANAHRRDLEITDHARAIKELMHESNFTASEVSIKLGGPSPATISKLLAILVLPRPVQNLVDCGKLPMSSAYTIATVKDAAQREHLIEEVLAGRMTRDRLVKHVKAKCHVKKTIPKTTRKRVPKERLTIQLGLGRSIVVSAPSMTIEQISGWLVGLASQLKDADMENRSSGEVVKIISDANKKITDDPLIDYEES